MTDRGNRTNYITSHWRGEQSLAWSFWINLAAVRLVLFVAQELVKPDGANDFSDHRLLVLSLAGLLHGALLIWQVIGVWRAAEKHLKNTGSMHIYWGVLLGLIITLWLTIAYALQAWRTTLVSPLSYKPITTAYSFSMSPDNKTLKLTGPIDPGITRDFKAFLASHPTVKSIEISSRGGNIYEARGLYKHIRLNRLNTSVTDQCTSACTTVFIAGTKRTLAPLAKLGFHQYRLDANYSITGFDPKAEQQKDNALFVKAGVSKEFIDKISQTSAKQMWFPNRRELEKAKVITRSQP